MAPHTVSIEAEPILKSNNSFKWPANLTLLSNMGNQYGFMDSIKHHDRTWGGI